MVAKSPEWSRCISGQTVTSKKIDGGLYGGAHADDVVNRLFSSISE